MSFSTITKFAIVTALAGVTIAGAPKPASAEPVGAFLAAGVVGGVLGAALASRHDEGRYLADAPVHYYGAPGYQRASVGPGRHTVCAWQERYDRHERYIGSRRICWVEAY